MKKIELVRVLPADLATLREISIRSFRQAFESDNAQKDMDAYIAESMSEQRLSAEIRNEESIFMFAYCGEKLAGYLKVNFGAAQTEKLTGINMEIERIYVLAEFQRSGVGQVMLDKALHLAIAAGVHNVWLGVWERNAKAIAFYTRNCFSVCGSHSFRLGDDVQTDLLMIRPMNG